MVHGPLGPWILRVGKNQRLRTVESGYVSSRALHPTVSWARAKSVGKKETLMMYTMSPARGRNFELGIGSAGGSTIILESRIHEAFLSKSGQNRVPFFKNKCTGRLGTGNAGHAGQSPLQSRLLSIMTESTLKRPWDPLISHASSPRLIYLLFTHPRPPIIFLNHLAFGDCIVLHPLTLVTLVSTHANTFIC